MLTMSKSQYGEGILKEINPEIGKRRFIHNSTMIGSDVGEMLETKMRNELF